MQNCVAADEDFETFYNFLLSLLHELLITRMEFLLSWHERLAYLVDS